LSYRDRLAYTP
jgi:hypothetical protein